MNDNKAMLMLDDTKWWSITEVFGVERKWNRMSFFGGAG